MVNKTGWYFAGWRAPTAWKKCASIIFSDNVSIEGDESSSVMPAFKVRMLDNVSGDLHSIVRFCISEDPTSFIEMAHQYRTPERLVDTTLRPTSQNVMDAIASIIVVQF
jgi:hypothetical protein